MSHFGRNIKKIRTAKKISQTAFADLFNLKRGSIGAYEEGRAEAKIDTIVEIAAFFKLSIEQLICKDLTFNEIYHIAEISQKFADKKIQNKSETSVPLVSLEDRSEFITKFNEQDYLSGLQSLRLPNINADSIAFELADFDFNYFTSIINLGDIAIGERMVIEQMENFASNLNFLIIGDNNIHWVRSFFDGRKMEFRTFNSVNQNTVIKKAGIKAVYLLNQFIISKFDLYATIENRWQNIENKLDKLMKLNGI